MTGQTVLIISSKEGIDMPENEILTNRTAKVSIRGAEYTITSKGEVFGKYGNRIAIRPDTSGYASFTAGRKGNRTRVTVHRLVAESFLPNPNHYSDVDHQDSNRMNPALENLQWAEHGENVKRAYARGNHDGRAVGSKNPRAKLNGELVTQMRIEYWLFSKTKAELSRQHNIPWSTVSHIVEGETWKNIPMPELTPELEEMLKKNPAFNPRKQ